ncbi:hypothetical protein [Joostella sp. CR20]|uniref:hypothetical protein n=1 Tax=Joostella sp. CR20 TaxID=2804312 RepID=UPI00313B7068
MKKTVLFCSLLMMISCTAQEKNNETSSEEISKNKPNERWTVNKEVDENGNVIRMDSTYVWSYSSNDSHFTDKQMDSIMQGFQSKFSANLFDDFMSFDNDTIFQMPFSHDRIFQNEFLDPKKQMQQMMRMADSLQQLYFQKFNNQKGAQKL